MIQKPVSMKLRKKKNVYCQRNSELRRLAGAMHCQIWVTRSVYMQFEAEDYRKIGFALYDYITLGYNHCSIDIIHTKDCSRSQNPTRCWLLHPNDLPRGLADLWKSVGVFFISNPMSNSGLDKQGTRRCHESQSIVLSTWGAVVVRVRTLLSSSFYTTAEESAK